MEPFYKPGTVLSILSGSAVISDGQLPTLGGDGRWGGRTSIQWLMGAFILASWSNEAKQ